MTLHRRSGAPAKAHKVLVVQKLNRNVKRYSTQVRRKLAKRGKKVDPAILRSLAKYYPALEKLAKE